MTSIQRSVTGEECGLLHQSEEDVPCTSHESGKLIVVFIGRGAVSSIINSDSLQSATALTVLTLDQCVTKA